MCEKNVRMSSSEWDEAWWENNPAVAGCHRFEVSSIAKITEVNKRRRHEGGAATQQKQKSLGSRSDADDAEMSTPTRALRTSVAPNSCVVACARDVA